MALALMVPESIAISIGGIALSGLLSGVADYLPAPPIYPCYSPPIGLSSLSAD